MTDILITGLGATLIMDLQALLRRWLTGVAGLDYALVGRWLGHMPQGRFRHASIRDASVVRGETWLGWFFHYLTGVLFAAALVWLWGAGWVVQHGIWPGLITGWSTALLPLLVMQPAFGLGCCAARTPAPWRARFSTLLTHTVFGVGLWLAAGLA
ncbi:MAG: DUF2938 domain-containing protein [Pseudomonadota bacterium]|nr:DUF2938 domain-containing protein [Pseudomonadota bacterium]